MNLVDQNWELIAAYLALRRHGSLSAAARALKLSQPTMRRRIEMLEAEMGQPLFTRGPAGLTPLQDDAGLLELAEAMSSAAGAFARRSIGSGPALAGTVRLSVPDVYGAVVLPPLIADIQRIHPGLVVELSLTNAVEDLLRRDADIAIRLTVPDQGALLAQKVAPTVVGLFAAPGPVAEACGAMDYATFCTQGPFISEDRNRAMERGFAALGLAMPSRVVLRTDSDLAQLAAIRAGVGVGICQVAIARAEGLVAICPTLRIALETWVVMHEGLRGVPRMRLVFDRLVAALNRRL